LQQHNDQRRKEYAHKAQEFANWVEEQGKKVESVQSEQGDASEKLKHIDTLYQSQVGEGKLKELEELQTDLTNNQIFGNKHTPFTIQLLKDRLAQYDNLVKNVRGSLEEEIEVSHKQKELEEDHKRKEAIAELQNLIQMKEGEIHLYIDNDEDYRTDDLSRFRKGDLESYVSKYSKFSTEGLNGAHAHLKEIQNYAGKLKSEFSVDVDISGVTNKLHASEEASKKRHDELKTCKLQLKKTKDYARNLLKKLKFSVNS